MEIAVATAAIAVFAAIAIGVVTSVIASSNATTARREIDGIIRAAQQYRALPGVRGQYNATGVGDNDLAAGPLAPLTEDVPIPGFTDGIAENVYGEDVEIAAPLVADTIAFEYTFNTDEACLLMEAQLGTFATNPALAEGADPDCTDEVLTFTVD